MDTESLDTRINNGFKQIADNYKAMIAFMDREIKKGYDNDFWERKKREAVEKKHMAENQITNTKN